MKYYNLVYLIVVVKNSHYWDLVLRCYHKYANYMSFHHMVHA